jgi:ubiquinone/menaquinone biosynthesis C-methylase UbiE
MPGNCLAFFVSGILIGFWLMDQYSAIRLIRKGVDTSLPHQVWYDLGAGRGTFTLALAQLLGPGSIIYAVDKDAEALRAIRQPEKGARISVISADFSADDFSIASASGVLMANALHYVEDQKGFLRSVRNQLLPVGRMIIIEYERETPNRWVPFPVGFEGLRKISLHVGFQSIDKIGEIPSAYGNGIMYAAVLTSG